MAAGLSLGFSSTLFNNLCVSKGKMSREIKKRLFWGTIRVVERVAWGV